MLLKLKDVPLGCFFTLYDYLCYKDNFTIGSDTNYCIVAESFMGRPKFCLQRGYCMQSNTLVTIVDERFLTQLTLF